MWSSSESRVSVTEEVGETLENKLRVTKSVVSIKRGMTGHGGGIIIRGN